jgi:hypothetical protein
MLAGIYAVPPVPWAACVMSKCKDNYPIIIRAIHKRKRKVLGGTYAVYFLILATL